MFWSRLQVESNSHQYGFLFKEGSFWLWVIRGSSYIKKKYVDMIWDYQLNIKLLITGCILQGIHFSPSCWLTSASHSEGRMVESLNYWLAVKWKHYKLNSCLISFNGVVNLVKILTNIMKIVWPVLSFGNGNRAAFLSFFFN